MNPPSSSTASKHCRFPKSWSGIFRRASAKNKTIQRDSLAKLQDLDELRTRLGSIAEVKPRADQCIEGTRMRILSDIRNKVGDLEDKNVVWIYGAPGSGKSAVSLSIKLSLHKQVTTSSALWRRVVYDLADQYPSARTSILSQLRSNKVDLTSTMDLFTSLIEEPFSKLTDLPPDHPWVIVIDALDECGGFEGRSSSDRKALLKTLRRWPQLPKYFKLIITSRDEGDIAQVLRSISTPVEIPSGRFLTENPQARAAIDASSDIRAFLEERMREIISSISSLPLDWPGKDVVSSMVSLAAGNFMWATTALKFIESGLDPQEQLEKVMGHTPQSTDGMGPLYSLYSTILKTSLGHLSGDESDAERLCAIFGTIVFAKGPLYDDDYTKLPIQKPVTANVIAIIRDRLHSVVDQGPALRFVHKSFDEFLLSDECPPEYAIRISTSQRLLTKLCLTTMTTELRFNICDLETSCLMNDNVPDINTKVTERISNLLSYSCCFWADHLRDTPFNAQLMAAIKVTVFDKLLYWFEVMSLLKEINRVSHSLLSVLNWSNFVLDSEFKDFIRDARRFIGTFIHPISQSAPHIYLSALPFSPEDSLVAQRFLPQFPQVLTVSEGKLTDWSPCLFTSEHHSDLVRSVAFSPDGKYFVSGSLDETICVCDSETGNLVTGPLRASDWVESSFFGPNGRRVWAKTRAGHVIGWNVETAEKHVNVRAADEMYEVIGCCCSNGGQSIVSASGRKGTVTLWNGYTGEQLHDVLKLPSNRNATVSFSPDGRYIVWAGPDDMTIRIWNLVDGSEIPSTPHPQPQFKHTHRISVLAFSVDGNFAVSASLDGTILIWNAATGDIIDQLAPRRVGAVAYSHTNRVLVSASTSGEPYPVVVWNATTDHGSVEWNVIALIPTAEGIDAITLSHDGQRVLIASGPGTVRMWDVGKKRVVPAPNAGGDSGYTVGIRHVAFSPCGNRLASLNDKTIRVWDTNTGESLCNLVSTTPTTRYYKIIFSPDGSHMVAFGSDTLAAWNVNTGDITFHHVVRGRNSSYTSIVDQVAFRSTDQRLVTQINNHIIRIWSWENNTLTEDLSASSPQPEDPTEPVQIIALSPDATTAIVYDKKRAQCYHYLWNTTTCLPIALADSGEHIKPEYGEYSPDGQFFVAVSNHFAQVRVWNARTGELAAGPSTFNDTLTSLALSPKGCHMVYSHWSENRDRIGIWIWDAHNGCLAPGPLKAHTLSPVSALAFSPNGDKLASVSLDSQIRIWNATNLLGYQPGSSIEAFCEMKDGWAVNEIGEPLFWVPMDHRAKLFWPHNVAVICGAEGGPPTKLNFTKFRYGKDWTKCFGAKK